jgi:Zn-dependent protease
MTIFTLFYLFILIYSIIAHEVAHGAMADFFGDKTARHAGRLTMNPLPHIDPLGSVLLPVLSAFSFGGLIIGWAKPVPYNPYNLRYQRLGETLVAAAGVITNFLLAVIFGITYQILISQGLLGNPVLDLLQVAVLINLSLGFFNLLPLPPFDGLRIITSLFPASGRKISNFFDRNGIVFMIISLFVAIQVWQYLYPYVKIIGNVLVGQSVF